MAELGDWSGHGNKKHIERIDCVYVSMTEDYEIEYFIDQHIKTRNYAISNANHDNVAKALENYVGRAPFKRDELNPYLEDRWKK